MLPDENKECEVKWKRNVRSVNGVKNTYLRQLKHVETKLCEEDDLNLKALEQPNVSEGAMFPEEINRYLRNQMQGLTAENGRLKRSLEECESQLQHSTERFLKEQHSRHLSPLSGLGRASELAASKIVELSKRVRELAAELEATRLRARTAESKVALLEETSEPQQPTRQDQSSGDAVHKENVVKTLKDKLSAASIRLCEYRNQNQQLRQELKVAQKALASEVGESVSVQSLSSSQSSWRGRAQQILALQQKLLEMREQAGERPHAVPAAEKAVRQLERERHLAQDRLCRDLKEANARLEEARRRLDGTRARCKVLEAELVTVKGRLTMLLDKGQHDQQLISVLSGQLAAAEGRCQERELLSKSELEKWEQERKALEQDLTRERSQLLQVQESLQQQMKSASPPSDTWASTVGEPVSREMESSPSCTQAGCRPQSDQQGELQVLSLAAEAERVRLLELLAVVNRRLETQRHAAADAEDTLRRERHRAARLETRLARAELERVGASKVTNYRGMRQQADNPVPEEFKYKIELLEEEALALRTRLQCVEQEKQDDLRNYTSLLEQARSAFLQAVTPGGTSLSLPSERSRR